MGDNSSVDKVLKIASESFITCNSTLSSYSVNIKTSSLREAHELHRLLLAAISEKINSPTGQ